MASKVILIMKKGINSPEQKKLTIRIQGDLWWFMGTDFPKIGD